MRVVDIRGPSQQLFHIAVFGRGLRLPSRLSLNKTCTPSQQPAPTLPSSFYRTLHSKPYTLKLTTCMAAGNGSSSSFSPLDKGLVSAEWLKENFNKVKILDATWYLPTATDKDAVADFKAERIPTAQFFNLDGVCDLSTDLPHMLPDEHQFAAAADALGISNDDTVIIYDRSGIFSAPRAWWTWHVFGHERVAVLNGGLQAWKAAGGEVDTSPLTDDTDIHKATAAAQAEYCDPEVKYQAKLKTEEVRSWEEVLGNVRKQDEQVIDARPAPRWRGMAPEPRPGLKLGHIPGSLNVAWDSVLKDGQIMPPSDLVKRFRDAGVDLKRPLVASCGSGTTACILVLAAKQVDPEKVIPVYDGSWSEWGQPERELPVTTSHHVSSDYTV